MKFLHQCLGLHCEVEHWYCVVLDDGSWIRLCPICWTELVSGDKLALKNGRLIGLLEVERMMTTHAGIDYEVAEHAEG